MGKLHGRKSGEAVGTKKVGRPTKLTPDVQKSVVDLLRRGNYLETAALAVGVDKATIRLWLSKGRKARRGIYCEFYAAVRGALSYAETLDVDTVRMAAATDWRAAAWRLEHRYPQRWGRKTKTEVTGKGGNAIQHEYKRTADDYSDDELAEIIAKGTA